MNEDDLEREIKKIATELKYIEEHGQEFPLGTLRQKIEDITADLQHIKKCIEEDLPDLVLPELDEMEEQLDQLLVKIKEEQQRE